MDKSNLETIIDSIVASMETADKAREKALPLHRQAIRHCSLAIRAIHRREFENARQELSLAQQTLDNICVLLQPHPEVYYAGFLQDAQKEYAEASLTLAIVTQSPLPAPQDLKVSAAAYVNGLAECVGELRRHSLDRMRQGELLLSERLLEVMDEIFSHLTMVDFPDAITRGLRRNTDIARGCLEKTRGDLTACHDNQHLIAEMNQLRSIVQQCSSAPAPNH
ncbi:MAG: haloacid dehalogenase [bacterium]|nr:haloacid dehalogenase [bacterium]